MTPEPGPYATRNTQYSLCLATSSAPDAEVDRELELAAGAGFTCVELWAPTLDAYLARNLVVWLHLQMQQHGIRRLVINGLEPLGLRYGPDAKDTPVNQARFLELCTHVDALGGGTIVLHPAAGDEANVGGSEAILRLLRTYADLAARFEVVLAFEFRDNSAIPTLDAAHDLIGRAARRNLCLSLSTRKWWVGEVEPRAPDALALRQLALVHLDDPRFPPAQAPAAVESAPARVGADPTRALCSRLAAAGFRGPYCIPPAPGPGTPLERARAAQQAAWGLLSPLYAGG